jgi:hypothetical protein
MAGVPATIPESEFKVRTRRQGSRDYVVAAGTPVMTLDGRQVGHALVTATYQEELHAHSAFYCLPLPPILEMPVDRGGLCLSSGSVSVSTTRSTLPRVSDATATVKGALDKEVIRRIVRAHINEVKRCYNGGLVRDPTLAGTVSIQFTIGPDGNVPVAVVDRDDLADRNVANCIVTAVKRWRFPAPVGGGNVVVTYPFRLVPG